MNCFLSNTEIYEKVVSVQNTTLPKLSTCQGYLVLDKIQIGNTGYWQHVSGYLSNIIYDSLCVYYYSLRRVKCGGIVWLQNMTDH